MIISGRDKLLHGMREGYLTDQQTVVALCLQIAA